MSEYDQALDCQAEWTSFWTSDYGRSLFRSTYATISEQRSEKGERDSHLLLDLADDEFQITIMALIPATCYYWSRQMLEIVRTAAKSLPDTWTLMKEDLPAVGGFFWFAKESEDHAQAYAWNAISGPDKEQEGQPNPAAIYLNDPERPMPDFNEITFTIFVKNPDIRAPIPCRTTWRVGESLRDYKFVTLRQAAKYNADIKEFEPFFEHLRVFAAMLSFIQQKIMVTSRLLASRATHKRVIHRGIEPEINIVKLRSVVHRSQVGEGEPVEWSCRWVVRGHWRQQWYPSQEIHRAIWITPYIKGPEDKPLKKPAANLFAVVR